MFKPAVGRVISVGLLSRFMHDSDELQSSNQSNDGVFLEFYYLLNSNFFNKTCNTVKPSFPNECPVGTVFVKVTGACPKLLLSGPH